MYFYEATACKSEGAFCSLPFTHSDSQSLCLMISQYDELKAFIVNENRTLHQLFRQSMSSPVEKLIKIPYINNDDYTITTYIFGIDTNCNGYLMLPTLTNITIISKITLKRISGERVIPICFYAYDCAFLCLYKNSLYAIPIKNNEPTLSEPLIIHNTYDDLLDLCPLPEINVHALGFLVWKNELIQFLAHEFSTKTLLSEKPIWEIKVSDNTCHKVIPLKHGIVITARGIFYFYRPFDVNPCCIKNLSTQSIVLSFDLLSDEKVLIGTDHSELILLEVEYDEMSCKNLCAIPYPRDIKCVKEFVYISSMLDDSLLINLHGEVLNRREHLGGIVDFTSIESPSESTQLVIGSNHVSSSSIYILKREASLHELTAIPLKYLSDLWSLCFSNDNYLLISFIDSTSIFHLINSQLIEIEVKGILKNRSILCAKISDYLVQVTREVVIATEHSSKFSSIVFTYKPKNNILHAAGNNTWIAISEANNKIRVLELKGGFVELHNIDTGSEVSAIELNEKYLSYACWNNTLHIIQFINHREPKEIKIEQNELFDIRSMKVNSFGSDNEYLLCGTADGMLISYTLNSLKDTYEKRTLGMHQVKLKELTLNNTQVIIGCSGTATLITRYDTNFQYLPIEVKDIIDIALFTLNEVLIIATKEKLILGVIEELQKINTNRISLPNLQVRKVTYKNPSILVLADLKEQAQLMTFNTITYSLEDIYQLQESGCSLCNLDEVIFSLYELEVICSRYSSGLISFAFER